MEEIGQDFHYVDGGELSILTSTPQREFFIVRDVGLFIGVQMFQCRVNQRSDWIF